MKKFILSMILFSWAFLMNAQESTTYDSKLGYDGTYVMYDYTNTNDMLKVGDSTWTYTVLKESKGPLKYDAFLSLDSVGGTKNNVTIKFQGKKFLAQSSWTDLKTVTWTGGHDTTMLLTESSTAQQYRVFRTSITGANDTFLAKILLLYIKFWE